MDQGENIVPDNIIITAVKNWMQYFPQERNIAEISSFFRSFQVLFINLFIHSFFYFEYTLNLISIFANIIWFNCPGNYH